MKNNIFYVLLGAFTAVAVVVIIAVTIPSEVTLRTGNSNLQVNSKEKFMQQWNDSRIAIEEEKQKSKSKSVSGSVDMNSAPEGYDADEWLEWVASLGISDERKKIAEYCLMAYKRQIPYSMTNIGSQRLVENPTFLDCSTMVRNAYWYAGLTPLIPTTTEGQINEMIDKPTSELITGDSVVYRGGTSGHVMTYIGTNSEGPVWCHASSATEGMKLNPRSYENIQTSAASASRRVRFGYFEPLEGYN